MLHSSAIHFRGPLIRQVSCYALLGGFQLPWPPSCCLYQWTPFMVSDERRLWHLNPAFGSSRIASSAYQKWPTWSSGIQRWRSLRKLTQLRTHLEFENRLSSNEPKSSNHSLYRVQLLSASSSYPGGNFGGNQLLDGSISLSPLYPSQTIELHVRIASVLQESFPPLQPAQE